MDITQYKSEVAKLEKEISAMSGAESSATDKYMPSVGGVIKYKNYFIIIGGCFLFLWIFKPKFVLKIAQVNSRYQIVVDKKLFIMWWFILVAGLSAAMFTYIKFKKSG